MHGDAEIAGIPFCFRPVSAVDPAVFRGDAGMIVDERRLDGAQHLFRDDTGTDHENCAWPQPLEMSDTFRRIDRGHPDQLACVRPRRLEVRLSDNLGNAPSRSAALHPLKRHEGKLAADTNQSQPFDTAAQQQRSCHVALDDHGQARKTSATWHDRCCCAAVSNGWDWFVTAASLPSWRFSGCNAALREGALPRLSDKRTSSRLGLTQAS